MDSNDFQKHMEVVLTNNKIWLLQYSDGMFAMHEGPDNSEYLPIWSSENKANIHCKDDWKDYKPLAMNLSEFNSWLNELADDEVMIAAFPDEDMSAFGLNAEAMQEMIETSDSN